MTLASLERASASWDRPTAASPRWRKRSRGRAGSIRSTSIGFATGLTRIGSPRPADEFEALHDAAIMGSRWVIDGNYSRLLPQRLQRATGFVLLDVPTVVSLYRYIRRCWFGRDRRGALEGGRDSVKWDVIHHIAVATGANRDRYEQMFCGIRLLKVRLDSQRALAEFYGVNGLSR